MAVQTRQMTVEEFDQFAAQAGQAGRLLEYVGGEIIEVVSNSYASAVAARLSLLPGFQVADRDVFPEA